MLVQDGTVEWNMQLMERLGLDADIDDHIVELVAEDQGGIETPRPGPA